MLELRCAPRELSFEQAEMGDPIVQGATKTCGGNKNAGCGNSQSPEFRKALIQEVKKIQLEVKELTEGLAMSSWMNRKAEENFWGKVKEWVTAAIVERDGLRVISMVTQKEPEIQEGRVQLEKSPTS